MPVVLAVGIFLTGLGVGLSLGYWLGVRRVVLGRALVELGPEAKSILVCLGKCTNAGPFGSPEFNNCVADCMRAKQSPA